MAPPMCHGLLYILIYNVVYILIRIASHGRSRRGPARRPRAARPGRERGGGRRDVSQCSKNTCVRNGRAHFPNIILRETR